MRTRSLFRAVPWLVLLAMSAPVAAQVADRPQDRAAAAAPACLVLEEGWIRMPPAPRPMLAGFGRIENACAKPVVVVGASSPDFDAVELHETRTVDGVSRMRHVPELRIDGKGTAVLQPGGLHLMLMRPKAELSAGGKARISLELSDGRTVQGEFEIRRPN